VKRLRRLVLAVLSSLACVAGYALKVMVYDKPWSSN
jgi:hypothetical protein